MLCDRTFACTAFAKAAAAVSGALHRGERCLLTPEAVLVLATVPLVLLTFTRTYTNGTRRWAVAAYRVLACALLPPGCGKSADQLQHVAASPVLDAVRIVIGECGALGRRAWGCTGRCRSPLLHASYPHLPVLAVRSSPRAKQP